MIKLTDSRGNKSATLGFAASTWVVGSFIFLHNYFTSITPFSLTDYGIFVATAVAPFVVREVAKTIKRNEYEG